MTLATLVRMAYLRSPRVKSARPLFLVVGRTDTSNTSAVTSAAAHSTATSLPTGRRPVMRLVPRPSHRASRGHDADWWRIAAGIGRALDTFDQGPPPACA